MTVVCQWCDRPIKPQDRFWAWEWWMCRECWTEMHEPSQPAKKAKAGGT